jgi:hypothetical protein
VLAHHKEEEEKYPLTLSKIADAQRKDRELKVYLRKTQKFHKRIWVFILMKTPKCYAKMEN